jgi:hypothetical protein
MKVAIMQPYFLPYIGYFQLINDVDLFIVYDNIKYTKKGWINRNRMLLGGSDAMFSIPLKKDSDSMEIRDRELSSDFRSGKFLNQFREAYRKAPFFDPSFTLLEQILSTRASNLFDFLHASIEMACAHLGINTRIIVSSTIDVEHSLQGQDKVLALCHAVAADAYVNPIGGLDLYSKSAFASKGIELSFLRSNLTEYRQFNATFVPWLSIIDVLMFNSTERIEGYLSTGYELI